MGIILQAAIVYGTLISNIVRAKQRDEDSLEDQFQDQCLNQTVSEVRRRHQKRGDRKNLRYRRVDRHR